MPNPTQKRVHYNAMLGNMSVAFMQEAEGFVHDKVFPNVLVSKKSNNYWVYDPESWNRDEMKARAPATETPGISSRLSTDTYNCNNFGLHEDLADEEFDNADEGIALREDTVELLSHKAMIHKELAWHNAYFKTGVWASDIDVTASADFGSVAISDASSKFIEGVKKAISDQKKTSHGYKPNTLILSEDVWRVLSDHVQFLDRVIGGATTAMPARVQLEQLAMILGLKEVLVSEAIINTAAEGQSPSNSYFATNGALLCYVAPRVGRKTPTAGATFVWDRKSKGPGVVKGTSIREFYIEKEQALRVEIEHNFDYKVVAATMGTFLHNLL